MTSRRRPVRSRPASAATMESRLQGQVREYRDTVELLSRHLQEAAGSGATTEAGTASLERQIVGDPGWRAFQTLTQQEFTTDGMVMLRSVCRLMSIANPLLKRGLGLRSFYVWGQGCEIVARANGKNTKNTAEQDVNAVVTAFVDDPANQRAVFGAQAREENEFALGTDGEVYIQLFTRPQSGWVQARTIPADEITEVITHPEDRSEPWYYRRVWTVTGYDKTGVMKQETRELLYPDVDYKPRSKPAEFAGVPVAWDAPTMHVHVNRPKGWLRGIPDAYPVVNWSRAYKEFLEQWAGLVKSLSKFAWRLTTEGRNRAQARAAVAAAGTSVTATGEPNNVGGTAITPLNAQLEAIPKSGATIDSESGRPLAMMVAAGLHLPVTMLLADPGQTGARATAETLDWPTELAMMARRSIWTAVQLRILQHVITESVRASKGALKGTVKRDPITGREIVTLAGDTDDTIDVNWPELDETDPKAVIDSIAAAWGTGTPPPELILRLILKALGIRDIESIMEDMVDEQGKFKFPDTPANAAMGPGQNAADLARAGGDPATGGPGSMGPDGEPMTDPDLDPPGEAPGLDPAAGDDGVTAEAVARQADADFGLFGGTGTTDDETPAAGPPGSPPEQDTDDDPAGTVYTPEFFQL